MITQIDETNQINEINEIDEIISCLCTNPPLFWTVLKVYSLEKGISS